MKHVFIVTIKTTNTLKEWNYEPNSVIRVPVVSNNKYNAISKMENRYFGSEYPSYEFLSITKCDNFLFSPILE